MDKDPDVGGGGEEDHLNKSQKGKGSEVQDECDFLQVSVSGNVGASTWRCLEAVRHKG